MGSGAVRAGTCQAPQTTATRSYCLVAARRVTRMWASRRSSSNRETSSRSGKVERTAAIASAIAWNGANASSSPGAGSWCSTMSSHHRSGSSYPAALASSPIGSRGSSLVDSALSGANRNVTGRSQKRTGTPCSTAHRSACHSGENSANGQ